MSGLLMMVGSGLAAAVAILLVLRNARRLGLVQAPNRRSSHTRPTPTGGGIGIVTGASLAAVLVLVNQPWPTTWIVLASLCLAAIGLWDDINPVPPVMRLAGEVVLVAVTLALAFPAAILSIRLGVQLPDSVLLALLTLLIVYWINLFNFMDGIDGMAGSEAVFLLAAPLGLALIGTTGVVYSPLYWWVLSTALATAVFLGFNWQPARIFMGDAGSLFLGFVIAIFALIEIAGGWISVWEALILPACFVTDATLTLLRRALRGEPLMTAHRLHAYQHLARRFGSHQRVALAMTGVNLVWLLPLATAAHQLPHLGPVFALVGYLPLAGLAFFAGAGRPEHV
ncbi:MAG: glycosyl transferase [Devosia sp.]|nr:glycosyl transferase [Devosia sp.]